jgi:hypothetical protein
MLNFIVITKKIKKQIMDENKFINRQEFIYSMPNIDDALYTNNGKRILSLNGFKTL